MNYFMLVGNLEKIIKSEKNTEVILAVKRNYKNENEEYDIDKVPILLWNGINTNNLSIGDVTGIKGIVSFNNDIQLIAEKIIVFNSRKEKE